MAARDGNRGRGGGRGKGGSRSSTAAGRQATGGASSTSSARGATTPGGSSGAAGARGGESGVGRASSSRTTRNAAPSRAAGGASGAARGNAAPSEPAAGGASASSGRAAGVTTGIAGGDVASGGIVTTGTTSSRAPRAADIAPALFGGGSTSEAPQTSERQRDLEPVRESGETRATSATSTGGSKPGASVPGVAGRGRPGQGLASWLAGAENPLVMMRRMQDDLDSVFRAFGIPRLGAVVAPPRELEALLARTPALSQTAQWSPQVEVFEQDGNLVIHADLPGVKREDVEVSVDNDVLTIRGQRRQEHRETEGGYRRTERSYGTFFRQIPLPDDVEPTQIVASYEDGVLEVIIPSPEDQPRGRRRVEIR